MNFRASPAVRKDGPKNVYRKIQSVLSKMSGGESIITLSNISVVEDNDPFISLLRIAIRTGDGISGIRYSRNVIRGQFIEDVYIYRMS